MNEKRRTQIIAFFLIAAVIWAGFNFNSESQPLTFEAPQTIQPLEAKVQTQKAGHNFLNIEKYEKAAWGKSPFYMASLSTVHKNSQVISQPKTLTWILSGIVFNKTSPTAIINKRPVKIGQIIDKAIVTNIDKEKVIIKHNDKEITLTVSKG